MLRPMLFVLAVITAMGSSVEFRDGATYHAVQHGDTVDDVNCPSVSDGFEAGAVRCEGCRAVAAHLARLVVSRRLLLEEALESLCDDVGSAELRQRRDGRRFWLLDRPMGAADDVADPSVAGTATLAGLGPADGVAATFHSTWEKRVLPCAPFVLKRYCFKLLSRYEEPVERCTAEATAAVPLGPKATAGRAVPLAPVLQCLEEELCGATTSPDPARIRAVASFHRTPKDCAPGVLQRTRAVERTRFLKYEAAFGNPNFAYVEDDVTPGLMVKNDYARGGPRAKDNEWLRRDDL